ncbi:MAG: transglycosylase SLT domain-containing protein [Patescibacteria group bacterium]
MTKTVQKNLSLIAGLFFIAQSTLAPAASAADFSTDSQSLYHSAANSAEPVIFNGSNAIGSFLAGLIKNDNISVTVKTAAANVERTKNTDKVIDNPEPTVEEIKDYVLGEIKKAGLNVREAEAIVNCESRWDPLAYNGRNSNGSNDKGLWQINSIHKNISDADKFDYKESTKWAIAKRLADGSWSAWSCSRKIAAK